jgi:hypothetical protein
MRLEILAMHAKKLALSVCEDKTSMQIIGDNSITRGFASKENFTEYTDTSSQTSE